VTGLVTATRYLTIIPLPGRGGADREALGRSTPWFPLVGLGLGLGLAGIDRALSWIFPPILGALLTVTAWKVSTGGLHLDGLADTLDGLMGRDPHHRLRIMRDSRIGAFGAIGLILVLLLAITALAELPAATRWRALVTAPVIGRAALPLLAIVFTPTGGGEGAAFMGSVGAWSVAVAVAFAGLVAGAGLGSIGLAALLAGLATALGFGWFIGRRLDGLNGDTLGAAVELTELAVLLTAVACSAPWGRSA
jgi:adenosylcobinamide-GDP ribazoletransferase